MQHGTRPYDMSHQGVENCDRQGCKREEHVLPGELSTLDVD
jgi:hypothetical protein